MTEYPPALVTAEDVTDEILGAVAQAVEWFEGEATMPVEDFIDRLCGTYAEGWDIEQLDTPAVRKIMKHARKVRRELRE
jgi:hypothetical protein